MLFSLASHLASICVYYVWAMDVTCILIAKGFQYLVPVFAWYMRQMLAYLSQSRWMTSSGLRQLRPSSCPMVKRIFMNAEEGR